MKVQIIIGSTRQGRHTDKLAKWVESHASKTDGIEAEIVDLADYKLPIFNEPISPQYNPDRKPEGDVKRWLDKLAEAEAYIIVTPEYNRSTSGTLKNAIDFIDFQLKRKPVALVGHGSTGGAQAISHLRDMIPQLQAITIPPVVYFTSWVSASIDDQGIIAEEDTKEGPEMALGNLLSELKWYGEALKNGMR